MPSLNDRARPWAARLHELVAELDVPGAVLGVSHDGERVVASAGSAGLHNPAPITADTVFQLGSISKLYTATLLLSVTGPEVLDRPVSELVPEAAWVGPEIRVWHLLTHSSGLGGDWFADTGRGDDALARYVTELSGQPRDVPGPPGRRYSYCNSGYAVLGRLIEVACETTFDVALRARLLDPIGAAATSTLPEDTILRPVATGHNRHGDGPLTADARWGFSRACGPLGGVCASAGDVLRFAELHLADGRAHDGAELLPAPVARQMRARRLETPPLTRPHARGLGFGIEDWPGAQLVGHDGETLGQQARLRIDVDRGLAFVVLTNGIPDGDKLIAALEQTVLADWGLQAPSLPAAIADPGVDPRRYAGRYGNLDGHSEIAGADGGALTATVRTTAEGLDEETEVMRLLPIGDDAFVVPAEAPVSVVRFADFDAEGRANSLFSGRVNMRLPD